MNDNNILISQSKNAAPAEPVVSVTATVQSGTVQYGGTVRPGEDELHILEGTGLMPFFAVGMVINIVMLGAFFVWAVKQWKKK